MSQVLDNEWVVRSLTGVAFVVVVMGAVWLSPLTNAALWLIVALLAWVEWRRAPQVNGEGKTFNVVVGLFPVPALMGLMWLGFQKPFDPWPIWTFLWMIWANDTGAFVIGKPFGKHKLWPAVSPGKSWEGTVGGVVAAG